MSQSNLLDHPTFKIADRRDILLRALGALLLDRDCRYTFRNEWRPLTTDEQANWDARSQIVELLQLFPAQVTVDVMPITDDATRLAANEPPPLEVEPPHDEPVDDSPQS